MGVKGLTTYINDNCKELLEQYELHGGYVVIDGDNLAIELYKSSSRPCSPEQHCNCAFGGDYNIYVRWVERFFDDLEKCGVTPLVIMDGGWETKKMKTLSSRRKKILQRAMDYNPAQKSKMQFLPANAIHAFTTCLLQRQTKIVRSVFENDPCIAGVAKKLNCPVISLDSDFYIFGVKFISLETLGCFGKSINGFTINCQMFKIENLLQMFPGLDHSVLTLLAVLLGNDYGETEIFLNFFDYMGLSNTNKSLDDSMKKIHVILKWLSERTLHEAVAAILSTVPVKCRRKVLDGIELVVNGYLLLPFDMLRPLGLENEGQEKMLASCQQNRFTFQGITCTLEARHYWRNYKINEISNWIDVETELPHGMQSNDEDRSTIFVNSLPLWFKQDYSNSKLPSFFVTMMFHRLFVCPIQIEDPEKPSTAAMSLKLIRIIDGLLVAGREDADRDLTYVIREERSLVFHKVRTVRGINSIDFPTLIELRYTPLTLRKRIFDEALEISGKESLIDDIPPEWRLFVVAALYWINPIEETPPNTCHLYALLFTMLLGVVEDKFGKYRSLIKAKTTDTVHANEIKLVQRGERNSVKNGRICKKKNAAEFLPDGRKQNKSNNESGDSIIEALEAVTDSDCLIAASFFLNNYEADEMLFRKSNNFDVTIVHAFSQFQCCLRYATNLNQLLGFPYKHPIIGKLYNGTMLYNLYIQFEKHFNPEHYIVKILEKTPSLLRLLNLLIAKMKMLVDRPIANGYRENAARERREAIIKKNLRKEKKRNNICAKSEENQSDSMTEESDESSEDSIEDIQQNFTKYQKIYTPKATKLLYSECAGFHSGRGVTKRKNKKERRSNQVFDDY